MYRQPREDAFLKLSRYINEKLNYNDSLGDMIIIDPYFFLTESSSRYDNIDYIDSLIWLLSTMNYDNLKIITSSKYNRDVFEQIYSSFSNIELIENNDFHDRFWISNYNDKRHIKGICVGTSLNGLGKRISLIAKLKKSDIREVMNYINDNIINNLGLEI